MHYHNRLYFYKIEKLSYSVLKRNQPLFRKFQNFKKSVGFLKMDIFKMSKIENLNKVSKMKSEFWNVMKMLLNLFLY